MLDQADGGAQIVLGVSQAVAERTGDDLPRTDFIRLAERTGAITIGNTIGWGGSAAMRRFARVTALDLGQAIHMLRAYPNARAYVSFSERVGIPLGALLKRRRKRPAHVVIAHRLNTRAKRAMSRLAAWQKGVDAMIALCGPQHLHASQLASGRATLLRAGIIDDAFYAPAAHSLQEDFILSVGSESRDYETLVGAVSETGIQLRILTSSPWARSSRFEGSSLPANVKLLPRVDYRELRDLYGRARLVVVPLHNVDYAAGLNGVLEGFCMGKAVIVSASAGIADYAEHMLNAYVVPPSDARAMATAIEVVCRDDRLRTALVAGARATVSDYANLDAFANALETVIWEAAGTRP